MGATPKHAKHSMKPTAVHSYTRTMKSGKVIHVKGYTRGGKKMVSVHGYTRTTKSGKVVHVKGYKRSMGKMHM